MTTPRRLEPELVLAVVAALTSTAVLLGWRGLTAGDDPWLRWVLVGAIGLGLVGVLLRRARLPILAVFAIQAILGIGWCSLVLAGSPVPLGSRWSGLLVDVQAAVSSAQLYVAPVSDDVASLAPVLLPAGLAITLVVDFLAVGLRRVSLAGLVLLAAYTVPISVLIEEGVSGWVFGLTAIGFLVMLHLQECELLSRWGRGLAQGVQGGGTSFSRAFRTTMATAAATSIALAVLLPLLAPRLDLGLLSGGFGRGSGEIRVANPMVDLRRDLVRGADRTLVRVTTDDPNPAYLRVSVLTRFSDNEWSPGDRSIPADQDGIGPLPALPGVDPDLPRERYDWSLSATDALESTWLPLPENVREVNAPGPWRWDESTRDFTSTEGEDATTAGLWWEAVGVKLTYNPRVMSRSGSSLADVSTDYIDLPDDFPVAVRSLAREVTASAPSKFEKAILLQDWFREEGGFEYTTDVPAGNGSEDLLAFLTEGPEGRRGYCEQFAASMAAMARSLNIPARVAVGFLRPERAGPRQWDFSSHDLHAWPELYISGSGWVRFEPTPQSRATGVPAYTRFEFERPEDDPNAEASPNAEAGDAPSADPGAGAGQQLDPGQGAVDQAPSATSVWVRRVAIGGGVVLLAGLILVLPRLLRRRRADRRAARASAEAAWAELRDLAVDLRLPWPEGTTPRATSILMADHSGGTNHHSRVATDEAHSPGTPLKPDAVSALARIALAVERSRYARPGVPSDVDWGDVISCRDEWMARASAKNRRWARWWPRSVFRGEPSTMPGSQGDRETRVERAGTIDRVN